MSAVARLERAAVGHGLERVDHQVDQHLLQLVAVDRRLARGAAVALDVDRAPPASRWRASSRQSSSSRARVDRIDVAGEFGRPRELQQLGDDQPHALDLLVDQLQLGRSRAAAALGPSSLAHQVEVALDHGDRVVHLVRDAGRELAHGGQLLAAAAAARCAVCERARALGHLGVELGVPALQRAGCCRRWSRSSRSRWRARRPISSPLFTGPTRASRAPASHAAASSPPSAPAGGRSRRPSATRRWPPRSSRRRTGRRCRPACRT